MDHGQPNGLAMMPRLTWRASGPTPCSLGSCRVSSPLTLAVARACDVGTVAERQRTLETVASNRVGAGRKLHEDEVRVALRSATREHVLWRKC